MGVDLRASQAGVPEKHLYRPEVCASIEEVGGEAVPQGMDRQLLVDPCQKAGPLTDARDGPATDGTARRGGRKQPVLGPHHQPVHSQELEECCGEGDEAILLAL